ncbi:MAG: hypothetical protein KAW16_05410, partial [candidate division Zixibacteria bacterium]|nr:hypothetical protein [candidate division Zixibacteria bacterium]
PPGYKISMKDEKAILFQRMDENEWRLIHSQLEFCFLKIIELAVPVNLLDFKEQKGIWFRLIGERQKKEIGRWPAIDVIRFDLPSQKGKPIFWQV